MQLSNTDVVAIFGARNSGKTTFAKQQIAPALSRNPAQRLCMIDPMAPHGFPNAHDALEALYSGHKNVALASGDPGECLPFIAGAWGFSTIETPTFIVCDEAPSYMKTPDPELERVMFQGRHRGVGMAILAQRPSNVAASYRSQAAFTVWMKMTDHTDLEVAKRQIGLAQAGKLPGMTPGQHIIHPPTS